MREGLARARKALKLKRIGQASLEHKNNIFSSVTQRIGQASLETIIIFGISSVILLILASAGLQSSSSTMDTLRLSQARTTVNAIASAAEEVWSQGPGASKKVLITIPDDIVINESGIINNRTINIRVLTRGDYTDVSEVSSVNITGDIPITSGEYMVKLITREKDVTLSVLQYMSVNIDKESYCESEIIYYYITSLNELNEPRETTATIQLIDPNGVVRNEINKTTISGLTNGSFIIPLLNTYGYWTLNAFDNQTSNFQRAVVINCQGGNDTLTNITIINCHASKTSLERDESSNIACWIVGLNPIETALYTINSQNYTAVRDGDNWWNVTLNCTQSRTYLWTSAWANDTEGNTRISYYGLPINVICNANMPPVINTTKPSTTITSQNNYVCINTTVTDFDENIDRVWAEVTTPSLSNINLTLTSTGAWCAGSANDSWYGAELQLTELGNYTLIAGWVNDSTGDYVNDPVNIKIKTMISCDPNDWITNNQTLFNKGTYNRTLWSNNTVTLQGTNITGTYTSKVLNSFGNTTWEFATWVAGASIQAVNITVNDTLLTVHLDEVSGPNITDASGKGNNGYIVGTVLFNQTGKINNSLYLNNVNRTTGNYITIPHHPSLNLNATGGTICVWVNITDKTQYRAGLVHKGENETYYDEEYSLQFYGATGTALPAFVIRDTLLVEHTATSSIELTPGVWQQVCGMYNQTVIKIYVNGIERGSTTITGGWTPLVLTGSLQIGAQTRYVTQKSGMKGYIDEVTIWKKGLTPVEVQQLYTQGIIRLNMAYRSCNDALCSGESWSSESGNNEYTNINQENQYFQYQMRFYTDNATYKPTLYNISVHYTTCNINYYQENVTCETGEDCPSNYCRQDWNNEVNWFCVANADACTDEGINREHNYTICTDEVTSLTCANGTWVNETTCNQFSGCDANSTKATYCGWSTSGTCMQGTGCIEGTPGPCNDCESYYTINLDSCSYTTGLAYCDKGCGATCDNSTDYIFNDLGDQCSYNCDSTCEYGSIDTCADPGDLYGYTCYFGTNGCSASGCLTSSTNCPDYCINDFNGGTCAITTRTDPSSAQTCYYDRECSTSGCNLSSTGALRQDYCDYCTITGSTTGEFSPALNATCTSGCPNSGTRYYDTTASRTDDCLNGATQILTENYQTGYTYPSQTSAGACNDIECDNDCISGQVGSCVNITECFCHPPYTNQTVFFEDFTPSTYYSYNWTRQATDWDSVTGSSCYGGSGDCAHADGTCTEAADWINTDPNIINLSGANNVYYNFRVSTDADFDPGDYLRVWCYNSSSQWQNFFTEDGGNWVTVAWVLRQGVLPNTCWTSNARFMITIIANNNNEDVHIDNFEVVKETT